MSDRPVLRALVAKTLPNGNVDGGMSFLPLEAAFQRVQDAVTFGVPGVHLLRDRLWSCPHCPDSRGTCCQCDGTRQVTPEIAAINLSNVWECKDCDCSACTWLARKRRTLKAAIEEAKIARAPKVPDQDGTFRSYFTRSK